MWERSKPYALDWKPMDGAMEEAVPNIGMLISIWLVWYDLEL
jgi:hypothetical protein